MTTNKIEYWTIYQILRNKKDADEFIKYGGEQDVWMTLPNGKDKLYKKAK